MYHVLYGDGIHDDTAAIQELIDSGVWSGAAGAAKALFDLQAPDYPV